MKNQRKLTALLMAAVVWIAAVCPAALAAGKEYSFAEQGIRFTLPEELRVLEYPVEDSDPLIPLTGYFTADDLNQYYEQTGTLLEAYFPDSGAFLSVEAWQNEESQAIGSYAAESESELQSRIEEYPIDWESDPPGRSTATVEKLAGQPFLLFSEEMGESITLRYYETVYGGQWIYLSLYPAQADEALGQEELDALGSLAGSVSFSTDPAAAVENTAASDWMETLSLVLFSLGLLLFVLLVIFLARSIRRSQPVPTVLPGFACRVSTPVGPRISTRSISWCSPPADSRFRSVMSRQEGLSKRTTASGSIRRTCPRFRWRRMPSSGEARSVSVSCSPGGSNPPRRRRRMQLNHRRTHLHPKRHTIRTRTHLRYEKTNRPPLPHHLGERAGLS